MVQNKDQTIKELQSIIEDQKTNKALVDDQLVNKDNAIDELEKAVTQKEGTIKGLEKNIGYSQKP